MKKIIPIAVVLFIILGGAGGYFLLKSKSSGNNSLIGQPTQEKNNKFSFKELIKRNQTTKCTFSGQDAQEQDYSGTIYVVSDKKARQDYEYTVEGKKEQMHLIIKDGFMYMWTSMQPNQGMKMAIQESDEENQDFEADFGNYYGQNLQQEFEYKCTPWATDESKFTLPTDVNFLDMEAMTNQANKEMEAQAEKMRDAAEKAEEGAEAEAKTETETNTKEVNSGVSDEMKEMMCASCSSAPDPEECRQSLGCE